MYLAPNSPSAPFGTAVLAGISFPLAFRLDARTVDEESQRPGATAIRQAEVRRLFAAA